ncbi:MAG: hypothetical protein ACREQX_00520 [Candidatus Binataceae bacterium]
MKNLEKTEEKQKDPGFLAGLGMTENKIFTDSELSEESRIFVLYGRFPRDSSLILVRASQTRNRERSSRTGLLVPLRSTGVLASPSAPLMAGSVQNDNCTWCKGPSRLASRDPV